MSNLTVECAIPSDMVKYLERKIKGVCTKIGFDDSKITWVIFDNKVRCQNAIECVLIGYKGSDYGYCIVSNNTIYISTLAITNGSLSDLNSIYSSILKKLPVIRQTPAHNDFLANVIIDEITHIQTQANHGTSQYDSQFTMNIQKYYT